MECRVILGDSMLQGRVVLDCNHCPECNWGGDTLASCFKQIGTPALALSVQGLAKLSRVVLLGVLRGDWTGRCISECTSGAQKDLLNGMCIKAQNSKQNGMLSFQRRTKKL